MALRRIHQILSPIEGHLSRLAHSVGQAFNCSGTAGVLVEQNGSHSRFQEIYPVRDASCQVSVESLDVRRRLAGVRNCEQEGTFNPERNSMGLGQVQASEFPEEPLEQIGSHMPSVNPWEQMPSRTGASWFPRLSSSSLELSRLQGGRLRNAIMYSTTCLPNGNRRLHLPDTFGKEGGESADTGVAEKHAERGSLKGGGSGSGLPSNAHHIGYKVVGKLEGPIDVAPKDMFAVVRVGTLQFKVTPGDAIYVEKLNYADVNEKLALEKVLLLGSKWITVIGRPTIPGAQVIAAVEEHALDAKVIIFKKRRRKNYRRHRGHRQELTRLRILDVHGIGEGQEGTEVSAMAA